MNRRWAASRALPALLAGLLVTALAAGPAAGAGPTSGPAVQVRLDRDAQATRIGGRFAVRTTVVNAGDAPLSGLIAHLNVLSTDPAVYVDPEDWSTARTTYLPPLAAHGSARLNWNVQAVNDGHFVVYVAVTAGRPGSPVLASGPLRVTVTRQASLDPAGALPVVIAVPVVLLVLLLIGRRRRLRLR